MLIFVDFLDFCALVFPGIFGTVISAIGHRGSEIGAFFVSKVASLAYTIISMRF